jgi:hypothetical protein
VSWTTIPRWLYGNDLPDEELQAFYAKVARRKVQELRRRRDQHDRHSRAWREADGMVLEAEGFLIDAERALARYRRRLGRGP